MKENILALGDTVKHVANPAQDEFCKSLTRELRSRQHDIENFKSDTGLVHPLQFVAALQKRVSKETTVCV